ncbi:MAG TPA: RHS repeat-associated core domain-containing protein, partial [Dehalococcoidales bacterium]|nr:RHS repeat-associated core domain-containing protein [Dehalococcoidales bacterium]
MASVYGSYLYAKIVPSGNLAQRHDAVASQTENFSYDFIDRLTGVSGACTESYTYNARYYDPQIGRFISADTIVQSPANPQSFNRYSYCLNNPLKYTDPSGHVVTFHGFSINQCVSTGNYMALTMIGSSSIFRGYLDFRSIDPVLTRTLET